MASWYGEKDAPYMNMEITCRIMMVLDVYNRPMQHEINQTCGNKAAYIQ